MMKNVRLVGVVATSMLAAPAVAQPGATLGPASSNGSPPVNAGTVVIVTPEQPVIGPAGGAGAAGMVPPPQNQPWSNVSHINGQLVKVGEHGDYLYDNGKTTNVASNPIGWLFGVYGLSISRAVHANVAIRGDVNWFEIKSDTGHEIGVSVPIYFRRVFDGPFLEPGVVTRGIHYACNDCDSRDESTGPEVLFGWQWTFDSGLNVAMAAGAMRNLNSSSKSVDAQPVGYFRVGYAF